MLGGEIDVSELSQFIYLDICALNRPFDDQEQMRIRLETGAVLLILGHIRTRSIQLVVSPVHLKEALATPDLSRREHILALLREFGVEIDVDSRQVRQRAQHLLQWGLGVADAAHVAYAELSGSDFVTVDDRLIRQLQRTRLNIWSGTPIAYCDKENLR